MPHATSSTYEMTVTAGDGLLIEKDRRRARVTAMTYAIAVTRRRKRLT